MVRNYRPARERPSPWLRKVEAIGSRHDEHLRGMIRIEGSVHWESPLGFEKVQS
jgi:hypothetical protein